MVNIPWITKHSQLSHMMQQDRLQPTRMQFYHFYYGEIIRAPQWPHAPGAGWFAEALVTFYWKLIQSQPSSRILCKCSDIDSEVHCHGKTCQEFKVSTYLDENLRVNRDSRGDLAIYVRAPAWSIKND